MALLFAAQPAPVPFECTARGIKLVAPPMRAEAACERVRAVVARRLGRRLAAGPARGADWVRVELRFSAPGIASASVTRSVRGRISALPAISVAVAGRGLVPGDVDMLASEVAAALGAR